MTTIVNGLFAGRSGIAAFGTAISVVGDNISNSNTLGYKSSRAEFEDLVAGGQVAGKVVGSGSSASTVSTVFEQGTLETTNRPLDLAIDGNGFFVVQDTSGKFYTRAGNFKVDATGYITTQDGKDVLGFASNGSGALEAINVNTSTQSSVNTTEISIDGNLDARADILTNGATDIPTVSNAGSTTSTTTYQQLNAKAEFSSVVTMYDSLGTAHNLTFFFFHTASGEYTANAYVNSDDVDPGTAATGLPRLVGSKTMTFGTDGTRTAPTSADITAAIPWNNGSTQTDDVGITFTQFTQFSANSAISSIAQDGKGVGSVTSVSVSKTGEVIALLSNGQNTTLGTIGLVNFANPEGLTRVGKNLLEQSTASGEPIIGKPTTGTFGTVQSGAVELSAVDIASEFVKIITLQKGFQANSRIITTINQLLNEIIQLA